MSKFAQLLALTCLAILGACNRPATSSTPAGIPNKVGSGQSAVLEFAPGTGPTPLQFAALDLDSKSLQKVPGSSAKSSAETQAKQEAAASLPGNDLNFIQRVINDSQAEEQAALYVASKSTDNEVRNYAALLGREHGKANQQLRKIAARRNVETPSDPVGQLRTKLDRLRQLSGAQMNQAFLSDFAVQAHMDSIALFEVQAAQGQDKELNAFVEKQLPRLRKHYEEGKALQGKYAAAADRTDI